MASTPAESNTSDVPAGDDPGSSVPDVADKSVTPPSSTSSDLFNAASTLEGLQTAEQRQVLDVVAELRKCGLESILSLPQLVVCGDQSAGKSSLLEALTEIPFPRNDNLCTRFATEIILRRALVESLMIKVIPDPKRPASEQESVKAFKASITSFDELPDVMEKATTVMGLHDTSVSGSKAGAFARDILSITIEGPSRPQLTVVDLPGLIQTKTKGVKDTDIDLVNEITDHYISQPRTICLAVISATNDYANQGILTKVRNVDPEGERTLGVITKPDRLIPNSGMESAFLALAKNEDIFFKLGWHVLKNRAFEETASSFMERNISEDSFFRRSNFKVLSEDSVGIDSLRGRLSRLLFNHVKQELPKLRQDLETALSDSQEQLGIMGKRRSEASDCRNYLMSTSLDFHDICKSAVNGYYQGGYFTQNAGPVVSGTSPVPIRRLRAVAQMMNNHFSDLVRTHGHKYQLERSSPRTSSQSTVVTSASPKVLSQSETLEWAKEALTRTRGTELMGNFNPVVIAELFWEQSSNWRKLAVEHVDDVAATCSQFLGDLMGVKFPKDVQSRLWSSCIQDALKERKLASIRELDRIWEDVQNCPINYNHYYTDTIKKQQLGRMKGGLMKAIKEATTYEPAPDCTSQLHTSASIDVDDVVQQYAQTIDPNMNNVSCEEVLDCLLAIYKVQQKTFIANVTTQVVERHIIRNLETIFSPLSVNCMADVEVLGVASEPASAIRQREFLDDRIKKLEDGSAILRGVLGKSIL
ncbi:hypothetical protein PG984_012846 [Apiospora sp. TS-2023a]